MYFEIKSVENGYQFIVANGEEEVFKTYVYNKPNQVIKAFREAMKPYLPVKKQKIHAELKVGD